MNSTKFIYLLKFNYSYTFVFILSLTCFSLFAQNFPTKPIKIIIGFPPGGGTDIVARMLVPKLSENLGQPFVVDNKPGANGILAMEIAARSPADGHTIFMGTLGNLSVNPFLYPNLPFNAEKDFTPLMQVVSLPFLMVINPKVPVNSLREFLIYAKSQKVQLNFSSSGTGGLPHLTGELLNSTVGINMVHIPYKGSSPSINDVISGQVQLTFEATSALLSQIKSGNLKALAITGSKRSTVLPDIPTVGETISGFDVVNWYGMVLPSETPKPIIQKLHSEIKKVLFSNEIKDKLFSLTTEPIGSSPEDFGDFIKSESNKWMKLIKDKNIKPE